MERLTRKYNRLADYDYSSNGLYFITVCAKNRIHYFSEITEDPSFVGADIIRPYSFNGYRFVKKICFKGNRNIFMAKILS